MKQHGLPEEVLINLARTENLEDGDKAELLRLLSKGLNKEDADEFIAITRGERLPSLSSDVIAKKIFDPVEHPDRLEYLLRITAGEDDIKVAGPSRMEGYVEFISSKKLIHDIPAALADGRESDTEFQVKAQEYIFTRAELYAADMLLIQYSAERGKKSTVSYENAVGALIVVLMSESPSEFREYDEVSDRYIHRFSILTAESGMTHEMLAKTVYVQLDKAYCQLKEGMNGETDDRAQVLLAAMKDINDPGIQAKMLKDPEFSCILNEIRNLAKDKEVQIMMLAEKYAAMDIATLVSEGEAKGRAEGRAEGHSEGRSEGQSELASAIIRLKSGETESDLRRSGVAEDTIALAISCR